MVANNSAKVTGRSMSENRARLESSGLFRDLLLFAELPGIQNGSAS
jgi:hypothetical protein